MADEKEQVEEKEQKQEKPEKKGNLPLLLGLIFGIILVQGLIVFATIRFIHAPQGDDMAQEETPEQEVEQQQQQQRASGNEVILSDAAFETVVNISGTEGSRFLKVRIELAYDPDLRENRNLLSVATNRISHLKSTAIHYLSGLTLREVLDPSAQKNISSDLLIRFNNSLPSGAGQFSNVYITEYIVQ
ncbi:flagellar basal body-associated FliL family protein [Chitinivibrio alkaliphilus]|uniref:Flagellar protein FliL n=1 Tax=Chitinivibrio alkaliphilus ACht1 TaxID=1313304 RepID=U7D914_9BACT|nr:flagellar basal body-associated FliL family protein [Chitinivibrio alkaliphilus]ERP32076.1 flagellar basal body-associated protein FliL [Chitinivibrio alkaliphilus ACht1]